MNDVPRQPITEFKSIEQANECLSEWQKRLFLEDWIIKLEVVEAHEMPEQDCVGYNHRFNTAKTCKISITKQSKNDVDCLEKHCEELTMVHELLHCKPWLTHYVESKGDATACYLEQTEHTMLDQMAKSLIMSKYGLPFGWFQNF